MFRSGTDEDKAAKAAAKDAAAQAKAADKAAAEWQASPEGRAHAAYQGGDAFYQVEIPHSKVGGNANLALGGVYAARRTAAGASDALGLIEAQGWHLETASWVYVQTGQTSRDKMLSSGQQVAVTGEVIGIYLFRRRV